MYVNYFLKEKKKQKDINLYDTFNNFIILSIIILIIIKL